MEVDARAKEVRSIGGIERYLSSGIIKSVGPSTAKKIVEHFGDRTEHILENDPEKLVQVSGIGLPKAKIIGKSWQSNKDFNKVAIFLQQYDITIGMSVKVWKIYGKGAFDVIQNNPYQLAKDMTGVGFISADRIALSVGVDINSEVRAKAGLEYVMNEYMKNGSCCAPASELLFKACEDLGIERPILIAALNHQISDGAFVAVDVVSNKRVASYDFAQEHNEETKIIPPMVFLAPYYHMERAVAKKLQAMQNSSSDLCAINVKEKELYDWLDENCGFALSDKQKEGVYAVMSNKSVIVTGGPGTGKTTMLSSLLTVLRRFVKDRVVRIKLAAPTGRAAKRMTESTGFTASTIHRLLEYDPVKASFRYDAYNQLKCDIIIIDESSMIDLRLLYALISALPVRCNVVFVGDVDQLPSVGSGAVLMDMIESKKITIVRLDQIFRQAAKSDIVRNAHLINHGIIPKIATPDLKRDCCLIDLNGAEDVPSALTELLKKGVTYESIGLSGGDDVTIFNPMTEVQILSPMQKGVAGVKNLNGVLQRVLNEHVRAENFIEKHSVRYYVGDKVMQIENNYNKNIFNGDIGFIESINRRAKSANIAFDGRVIEYSFIELGQIVHAYAITIHKSQGGEYPVIILPVVTQHFVMLNRNLIYTALTRAKKAAILLGQRRALTIAVNNISTQVRHTMLSVWISELC